MNIKLQLCGLAIVLFLFILSNTHKKLGLESERIFQNMLIMTIASISLDIFSVIAITYRDGLPDFFVKFVCKAYLISMVFVGWVYFCYVMLDLNSDIKWHMRTKIIMAIVTVVESIIIAVLPIQIHVSESSLYTEGLSVYFTYGFTIFYILSSLTVAAYIIHKKNSRRGMAMAMTTIVWIIAATIQAFNNALLLVGFAMSTGVMIVFIVLDNPDTYLDRQLGCFNSYALNNFITAKIFNKEKFSLLDISVSDIKSLEDKNIDIKLTTRKLISLINNNKKIKIFKNLNTGLVLVSDNEENLILVNNVICDFLKKYENIVQFISVFTVKDANELGTPDNLYKFLTYVRDRNEKIPSLISHTSENTIKHYREMQQVEEDIKLAIKEDRIEVFYQPIHDLKINKTTACEALARIRYKDGTLLSPAKFIPVAENTGLIKIVGEIVLDKVCKFLKESEAISLGIEKVHVNLSAVQCDDNQTASKLIDIVEKNNVNAEYISFEITETAVSSNKEALLENMNSLINYGFSFSLDDFGKGESNLMYIVDLPVNELKIDMDLSQAYFYNPKAKVVVNTISSMTKQLEVPFVAEGIETLDEVNMIKNGGVTHVQGYYYSKPVPKEEFIEYLKHRKDETESTFSNKLDDNQDNIIDKIKIHGNRILLVEDNELNAEIAKEILSMVGFDVTIVSDGIYAVEEIKNSTAKKYDLILMDIRMPIMDGFEAARRIRALKDKKIANTPIIALSSMDSKELRLKGNRFGVTAQLSKPFIIDDFNALVEYNF